MNNNIDFNTFDIIEYKEIDDIERCCSIFYNIINDIRVLKVGGWGGDGNLVIIKKDNKNPEKLYKILLYLKEEYGINIPHFITKYGGGVDGTWGNYVYIRRNSEYDFTDTYSTTFSKFDYMNSYYFDLEKCEVINIVNLY
jgi:hypothetical protein